MAVTTGKGFQRNESEGDADERYGMTLTRLRTTNYDKTYENHCFGSNGSR